MRKFALILSIVPVLVTAQFPFSERDLSFVGRGDVSAPVILTFTFLTNLSTTANSAYQETAEFTPSSNAFLIAHMFIDTFAAIGSVTNTGTTNLTWWPVCGTNITSVGDHFIYVTQLPIGTAPFAMKVGVTAANNPAGAEIHVWEVTNANTSALWGSNAIVQAKTVGGTTASPYELTFPSTITVGNAVFVGVGNNSGTDIIIQNTWVTGFYSGHTTPTHELGSYYRTNAPALTSVFTTNSVTRYHSMFELRN